MGNCSSCLGAHRRDSHDEEDETRLLFDDPHGMPYGSFGEHHMNAQDDPLEVQREIEALQRVVARTSDNMVDIFEIAPHGNLARTTPTPYALVGQETRQARYQNLLSKLVTDDELAADVKVDWTVADDDTIEMQQSVPPVKAEAGEPLVGNFADAAKAVT